MSRAVRLALVALLAMVAVTPLTGSAEAVPGGVAQDTAAPRLHLVRQTAWVAPGTTFVLRVAMNGRVDPGTTVEATVFSATGSRADFAEQLDGQGLGERLADSGPLALRGSAAPTAEARFSTDGTPADGEVEVALDAPGVYPVEARLVAADGEVVDRLVTHLVHLPDAASDAPPLDLAVVMPIDGGPGIRPDGGRRVDPGGSDRVNTLLAALNSHSGVPLTVVPTPDTVVSMSGTPRIARLRRAVDGRQVLSSQYVPLDVSAWVAAGMDDDLVRQTTAGEVALADRLVDRPDRRTAVADATLTADAVGRLRDLGADQLVVPEEALAPLDASAFPTTLAQPFEVQDAAGHTTRSVAADLALREHIDRTDDPVLDASNLLADLAVLFFDRPAERRGVVLTLPTVWAPTDRFLDTLLAALADDSVVAPVTIDQLFQQVPEATVGGPADPGGEPLVRTLEPEASPSLGGYPEALPLTRLTTQGFLSFAGRDNPVVLSMQRRLLVSGSAEFDRSQRRAYLTAISLQIDNAASSVRPPERGNITLTSRSGRIPLNISNENLYDVTVRIQFDSDKLSFPHGDTLIVHLPRSAVRSFDIDVEARSSGTFPLRMTITSPDEIVVVSHSRFTVRSTAVSGVGLVLSIGAGLFLALWWASHFRKVRRARKLVAADEAAAAVG